jgi:hypothetical protein
VLPPTSPTLHQLQHGQNLFIPPPNWLQARLPDGTIVGKSVYHGLPDTPQRDKEMWSLSLASRIAEEDVDLIAPAEQMKELFCLPYTSSAVSLSVHRLGTTLIVDKGPRASDMGVPSQLYSDAKDKELYSKFLYRSTLPPPVLPPPVPSTSGSVQSLESKLLCDAYLEAKKQRHERFLERSASAVAASSGAVDVPSLYFDEHGTAHTQPKPQVGAPEAVSEEKAFRNRELPGPVSPPFRRVCQWRFNGYNMLLGSDLLAFHTADGRPISLKLQDIEKKLTQGECLDMYLDNTVSVLLAQCVLCCTEFALCDFMRVVRG